MMTSPTVAQLIRLARAGLDAQVAPTVTEPFAAAALAQAGIILRYVEAVVDHEQAWLREEITDIHDTARGVIAAGCDRDGRIAEALRDSQVAGIDAADLPTSRRQYQHASEVLSRCLEASVSDSGPAGKIAIAALERRLDRELQIKAAAGLSYTARVTTKEGAA